MGLRYVLLLESGMSKHIYQHNLMPLEKAILIRKKSYSISFWQNTISVKSTIKNFGNLLEFFFSEVISTKKDSGFYSKYRKGIIEKALEMYFTSELGVQ